MLATACLFNFDDGSELAMEDAHVALENGITKLPKQQREVYQLCYQKGLSYQEVADKLNISHGTVQTHMKLALKFLRTYIIKHSVTTLLVLTATVIKFYFFK